MWKVVSRAFHTHVIRVCSPSQSASKMHNQEKRAHKPLRTSWISPKMFLPSLIIMQSCYFYYRINKLFSKLPPPHPSSLRIACTVRWSAVSFSVGIPRLQQSVANFEDEERKLKESKTKQKFCWNSCWAMLQFRQVNLNVFVVKLGLCSASSMTVWKYISLFRQPERSSIQCHESISSVKTYMTSSSVSAKRESKPVYLLDNTSETSLQIFWRKDTQNVNIFSCN